LLVTNEHVVRGSTAVEVAFADGQRVAGTVLATDVVTDLALVQADRTGLPEAQFQSNLPRIGELAIVIGSPLGFQSTVTAGIISGSTGRSRAAPVTTAPSAQRADLQAHNIVSLGEESIVTDGGLRQWRREYHVARASSVSG
jgi:serine protease DegQ